MDTRHRRRKQRIGSDASCRLKNGIPLADNASPPKVNDYRTSSSEEESSPKMQNGCITGLKDEEVLITSEDVVSPQPMSILNKFPFDRVDINTLFKESKNCKNSKNDETELSTPYKENVWAKRNGYTNHSQENLNGHRTEPKVFTTTCQIPNGLLITDMQPYVVVNINMWDHSEFDLNFRNSDTNEEKIVFTENLEENLEENRLVEEIPLSTGGRNSRNEVSGQIHDTLQLKVLTKPKEINERPKRTIKWNYNFYRDYEVQIYPHKNKSGIQINRGERTNFSPLTPPHMNPTVALVRADSPLEKKKSKINRNLYECKKCLKSFVTRSYPALHDKFVHLNIRDFPCLKCPSKFHTNDSLSKHVACVHLKLKMFECMFCKKRFSLKPQLKQHKRDFHNGGSPFTCALCNTTFKRKQSLRVHFLVHNNKRKYQCDVCSMNFKFKSHLNTHISSIHLKVKHSCIICSKKFSTRTNMLLHKRSLHYNQRPYECKLCGEKYTTRSYMNLHIRSVHEKQRPYQCDICKHKSKLRAHLSSHLRLVHEKLCKYHCQLCMRKFGSRTNLRIHIKSVHNKIKHKCGFCNKSFSKKGILFKHIKEHETGNSCGLCYKKLSGPNCLKKHITKVHTFFN